MNDCDGVQLDIAIYSILSKCGTLNSKQIVNRLKRIGITTTSHKVHYVCKYHPSISYKDERYQAIE